MMKGPGVTRAFFGMFLGIELTYLPLGEDVLPLLMPGERAERIGAFTAKGLMGGVDGAGEASR